MMYNAIRSSSQLYTRTDKILLALLGVMLLAAAAIRWQSTAFYHQNQNALTTFDFWLGHAGFYASIASWLLICLQYTPSRQWTSRLLAVLLAAITVAFDIAISTTIAITGDSNSLYGAFFFLSSIAPNTISLHTIGLVFIVAAPLLFIVPIFFKRRLIKRDHQTAMKNLNYLIGFSLLSIALSILAPFTHVPKSLATPPVVYLWKTAAHVPSADDINHMLQREYFHEKQPVVVKEPYNIVIVALESTRASSISHYNKELSRKTAFYDELAESSLVAEKAYAIVPHTSKALTSINCGREPYLNFPILEAYYGIPSDCLAKQLSQQGYDTAFFQSAIANFENRAGLVKEFGFKEFYPVETMDLEGYSVANMLSYEDDVMLPKSQQWLQQRKANKPFFAFYLTGTPHWQYWVPPKYGHHQYITQEQALSEHHNIEELNLYLNAVYYQDKFLEQLFAQYKAAGQYDNTIFVLVGDHGENFGEHRHFQHNNNMYQEVLHIPLLIHAPAIVDINQRLTAPVSQLNIMPTLQHLLGSRGEQGSMLSTKADNVVFSACWYWRWCLSRVDQNYKYIYNYQDAPAELYDLRVDPGEMNNIAPQRPQLTAKFEREVRNWFETAFAPYASRYQERDPNYLHIGLLDPTPPSAYLINKDAQESSTDQHHHHHPQQQPQSRHQHEAH